MEMEIFFKMNVTMFSNVDYLLYLFKENAQCVLNGSSYMYHKNGMHRSANFQTPPNAEDLL